MPSTYRETELSLLLTRIRNVKCLQPFKFTDPELVALFEERDRLFNYDKGQAFKKLIEELLAHASQNHYHAWNYSFDRWFLTKYPIRIHTDEDGIYFSEHIYGECKEDLVDSNWRRMKSFTYEQQGEAIGWLRGVWEGRKRTSPNNTWDVLCDAFVDWVCSLVGKKVKHG